MNLLQTLPNFLAYFASAIGLFGLFTSLYIRLTPYAEIQLIRQGNISAAVALVGTLLGFALPLASAIAHSVSIIDMLIWGVIAMLVQVLVFVGRHAWCRSSRAASKATPWPTAYSSVAPRCASGCSTPPA